MLGLEGQDNTALREFINPVGWCVPGLAAALKAKPTKVKVTLLAGTKVEISRYTNLPIRKKRGYISCPAPWPDFPENHQLVTTDLVRYSVGGRPFLYTMYAYPCGSHPATKTGGCIGSDFSLAYYDQDGDGKFERMEFMPVVIGGDPAWPWHPQLPIWTRAK